MGVESGQSGQPTETTRQKPVRPGLREKRDSFLATASRHVAQYHGAYKASSFALVVGVTTWLVSYVPMGDTAPKDVWQALYMALRFFTLDAQGFPVAGTSTPEGLLVVALMFVAPLFAGGVLLDALWRFTNFAGRRRLELMGLRRHAVVCGWGSHGMAIARWLLDNGWRVIVVDLKPRGAAGWLDVPRAATRPAGLTDRVPFVHGDINETAVLRAARAESAGLLVMATHSSLENVRGILSAHRSAAAIDGSTPHRYLALTEDPGDSESLEKILADCGLPIDASATQTGVVLASRYELVAGTVADGVVVQGSRPRVLVIGAGRYGRAIIRKIASQGGSGRFVVGDANLRNLMPRLQAESAGTGWEVVPLHDPASPFDARAWAMSLGKGAEVGVESPPDAIFICLDDDLLNLYIATCLRNVYGSSERRSPDLRIVLRIVGHTLGEIVSGSRGDMEPHAVAIRAQTTFEAVNAAMDRLRDRLDIGPPNER